MKIAVPRVKMITHKRANWGVGRSENMGESSNNAGAPLVDIWLTDLPKTGEVGCPTYPPGSDTQTKPTLSCLKSFRVIHD